jgi:IS30 family transposase
MMNGQGQPRGTVHISGRPAEAGDRAVPGHWEGGLLFGARSSTVAALAGRKSRFVMLVRLPGSHTADAVAGAIATLPERLRRSLTWDLRGSRTRLLVLTWDSMRPARIR